MKKYTFIFCALLIVGIVTACGEGIDVVESGTYTGTIDEINAEETEIYVETAEGKRLELYFTDTTELTQDGEAISFSKLAKGQKVEVEVEKTGKRLDPISVKLLE